MRSNATEVLVATIGSGMQSHKLELISELWNNNIKAEIVYNENPKPQK